MKYDILRAKPQGSSCRIRVDEPGEYYVIPVPIGETVEWGRGGIRLNTNEVFKKRTMKRNYILLPKGYVNADMLYFSADHNVCIKSNFNNHVVKRAFDGGGQARVDLSLDYRENVLSAFVLKGTTFFPKDAQRVDEVWCKPTTDLKRYVSIYLPSHCTGKPMLIFEDELYEY